MGAIRSNSGSNLKREWGIPADHVLYHHKGTWFHVLERFPGALCDPYGYILFASKAKFEECPGLKIRVHVRAPAGIANIAGYIRKKDH